MYPLRCGASHPPNDADIQGTLVNRKFIQFNIQNYFMFIMFIYPNTNIETLAKSLLDGYMATKSKSIRFDDMRYCYLLTCVHTLDFTVKYEWHRKRYQRNVES